jgi:DNA-binding NarL/FixJ family response regulator
VTKIYLYSNQPVIAKGLEALLAGGSQFRMEFFSTDLPRLITRLSTEMPHILLLDIEPDQLMGALGAIKGAAPECKVVLWVNTISRELAFQAMGRGVRGILRKTLETALQIKCLQKVSGGELWFEKALTESFLTAKRVILSRREGQLVTLLSKGFKNKEIASALQLSEGTVKVYLARLFRKVGVEGRFELALFGLQNAAGQTGADGGDARGIPSLQSLILERRASSAQVE